MRAEWQEQLRRFKLGLCRECDCKLVTSERCVVHAIIHNERIRKVKGCKKRSVDTQLNRYGAAHGLGEFYIDKQFNKQFRWTDKRILRLLKNGKA